MKLFQEKGAPESRGASSRLTRRRLKYRLRSLLLLDRFVVLGFAVADRNGAGLFRLGDFTHQIHVQETVLKLGALDLDEVGKLEHAFEGARRNALVKHVAALLLLLGVFLAADGQGIFLRYDGKLGLGKAGDGNRDAILVVSGPLDVIGRITGSCAFDALVEQRKQPVETDGRTVKGARSKVRMAYPPSEATCGGLPLGPGLWMKRSPIGPAQSFR